MEKQHSYNRWQNYVFTIVIVAAVIAVYLLAGGRSAESAPLPTPTPTEAPTPVPTPFGRTAVALIDDLGLYGVAAVPEGSGYLLHPEGDSHDYAAATLTLALADHYVSGFVLAFPALPVPDSDRSDIAGAVKAQQSDTAPMQQAAMETVLSAVCRAYDFEGALPETIRSAWCAEYLALQQSKKGSDAAYGQFRFAVYTLGSGDNMRLCCAVQHE